MKKTHYAVLGLALGAALAALSIPAVAQAQTSPPKASTASPPVEVKVFVTLKYDSKGVPTDIICPEKTELSKSRGDWAHWILDTTADASLTVKMKKDDDPKPFKHHPKTDSANGKHARSDAPTEGTVGQEYPYNVFVDIGEKKAVARPNHHNHAVAGFLRRISKSGRRTIRPSTSHRTCVNKDGDPSCVCRARCVPLAHGACSSFAASTFGAKPRPQRRVPPPCPAFTRPTWIFPLPSAARRSEPAGFRSSAGSEKRAVVLAT